MGDAQFDYNVARWKPQISYVVQDKQGELQITPNRRNTGMLSNLFAGQVRNKWVIHLSDHVPMDLSAELGVGESRLNLKGLQLKSLNVHVGVGESIIDLSGPHAQNIDVEIRGGVGEGAVVVPNSIGVQVSAGKGLGEMNVEDLIRDGDHFVNEQWGKSEVTMNITVRAGIGAIKLRTEDFGKIQRQ